eukprot:XP_024303792.1 proline-rich protein 26 isoform X2 [Homo sapiens]
MESSRWDKDPPGERRPQQSQHWRARDHGARGCGPRQPTATASPRPGLWITPAHGSHTPQTNTRRTQADNIFIYVPRRSLACPPWLHSIPHIKGTILSEALSGFLVSDRRTKTVAGLRWLWLRKEATPTASRTTLSSSLAPRGRGVNTLGRGGCTLMVLSSDLCD